MIRVRKPRRPPAILGTRGQQARQEICRAYKLGQRQFVFDASIYGDAAVKARLRAAQHDKCCFCEAKIAHIQYGDVEHFRPKAGYRQHTDEPLTQPGYYWLAYDWSNLFLCCQLCNQRHKGNLFPLRVATRRATRHTQRLTREEPLFIDPARDDPAHSISFRGEVAFPVGNAAKGQATIEALQHNRPELQEQRRALLKDLRELKRARDFLAREFAACRQANGPRLQEMADLLHAIDARLEQHCLDSAEYAAMARALLRPNPHGLT